MGKKIYHFDKETKIYLGSTDAKRSPADPGEVYLVPAYATDVAPPAAPPGQASVFEAGAWSVVKNNLGVEYWDPETAAKHIIEAPGVEIPAGGVTVSPPPRMRKPKWDPLTLQWLETALPDPKWEKFKVDMTAAESLKELQDVLLAMFFPGA
jgi:hypothetical protein